MKKHVESVLHTNEDRSPNSWGEVKRYGRKVAAVLAIGGSALAVTGCKSETTQAQTPETTTSASAASETHTPAGTTPTTPETTEPTTEITTEPSEPTIDTATSTKTPEVGTLEATNFHPNGFPEWEGVDDLTAKVEQYNQDKDAGGIDLDGILYKDILQFVAENNPGWEPYSNDGAGLIFMSSELQDGGDENIRLRIANDNEIVEFTMWSLGVYAEPGSKENQAYETWRDLHYSNYEEEKNEGGVYMTDRFVEYARKGVHSSDPVEQSEGISYFRESLSARGTVLDCTPLSMKGGAIHNHLTMECAVLDPYYFSGEVPDDDIIENASFWLKEIEISQSTGATKLVKETNLSSRIADGDYDLSQFSNVQGLVGKTLGEIKDEVQAQE